MGLNPTGRGVIWRRGGSAIREASARRATGRGSGPCSELDGASRSAPRRGERGPWSPRHRSPAASASFQLRQPAHQGFDGAIVEVCTIVADHFLAEDFRIGQSLGEQRVRSGQNRLNDAHAEELVLGSGDDHIGVVQGCLVVGASWLITPAVDQVGEGLPGRLEDRRLLGVLLALSR